MECIKELVILMQTIQSKKGTISASMEKEINNYITSLNAIAPKESIKNELKKMFKQNKLMEAYNQILPIFEQIITKLNYTGGICFDFKFDFLLNKINIFEINPRFGGSAFSHNFIYDLLCIKK